MIVSLERRRALLAVGGVDAATVSAAGPHAIAKVQAFGVEASGGGSAYTVLQVDTRSGVTGYGECRPLSKADVRALSEMAVGRSAMAYAALGPTAPEPTRGGLNMALLDIVGKVTNAPVFRVLGGPTRFKARAMAKLNGNSDSELGADLQRHMALGVRAFGVPLVPLKARNQGSEFVKSNVARFQALRSAAPTADFAIDGRDMLTPGDAGSLATALEHLHPLWFDEPCPVSNLRTIRKISDETVVPLGFGRDIQDAGTFQDLLRDGLIDLVRPDLLTFGISGVCRIAAMAETYYVAVAPWHDAGPIATAAALHAAASIPNFYIFEIPGSDTRSAVIQDGYFDLPKGPGLGVSVNTRSLERNRIA